MPSRSRRLQNVRLHRHGYPRAIIKIKGDRVAEQTIQLTTSCEVYLLGCSISPEVGQDLRLLFWRSGRCIIKHGYGRHGPFSLVNSHSVLFHHRSPGCLRFIMLIFRVFFVLHRAPAHYCWFVDSLLPCYLV